MAQRFQFRVKRYIGQRDVLALQQNVRYYNLAAFMYKIQPRYGPQERFQDKKPAYEQQALENLLKRSRILTKEGEVRQERLEKLAKSLGYNVKHLPKSNEQWGSVTEGGS